MCVGSWSNLRMLRALKAEIRLSCSRLLQAQAMAFPLAAR